MTMTTNPVVSREDWLKARLDLLAAEKELLRQKDELTRRRMAMPWERVEKSYGFAGPDGELSLFDLFGDHSQLIVYHFMFGPDWEQGCKSCSFWADNFNLLPTHLAHRDISFYAVSRAPLARLQAYKDRLGWSFPWVSAEGSDFNFDYQAAVRPDELARGEGYFNYKLQPNHASDMVGISVFARNEAGEIFHTYSSYQRGVEAVNGAYGFIDMTPKGRHEEGLPFPMAWVQRRDQY